jgi:hypothetical protein
VKIDKWREEARKKLEEDQQARVLEYKVKDELATIEANCYDSEDEMDIVQKEKRGVIRLFIQYVYNKTKLGDDERKKTLKEKVNKDK